MAKASTKRTQPKTINLFDAACILAEVDKEDFKKSAEPFAEIMIRRISTTPDSIASKKRRRTRAATLTDIVPETNTIQGSIASEQWRRIRAAILTIDAAIQSSQISAEKTTTKNVKELRVYNLLFSPELKDPLPWHTNINHQSFANWHNKSQAEEKPQAHMTAISALLSIILSKQNQTFRSQRELERHLEEKYQGTPGFSESALHKLFAEANRALKAVQQKNQPSNEPIAERPDNDK